MAIVMLAGSLCFFSMPYLIFSLVVILALWFPVALRVLSSNEIASTLLVSLIGAALSIFILHSRILGAIEVFELKRRVDTLEAILPMCAKCKKTRDHTGKWLIIEEYIEDNQAGTQVSHGSCPACKEEMYGDFLREQEKAN
jgi:hypothetical protein